MSDASFHDADGHGPLALRAETADELPILSALCQDAVLTVGDIRYDGTDTTLKVPFGDAPAMAAAFTAAHTRRFGFGFEHRGLIVESLEAEAIGGGATPPSPAPMARPPRPPSTCSAKTWRSR